VRAKRALKFLCASYPALHVQHADHAGPLYAWRRGTPGALLRGAERAGGDVGEEWPLAGGVVKGRLMPP
jgi:hypothetical protein